MRRALALIALITLWPQLSLGADALASYKKGISLYNDGEFTASLRAMLRARKFADGSTLRARIELYVGLNRAILGQKAPADRAFAAALVHDPNLRLDPQRFKRELIEQFDTVRRGMRGTLAVTASVPANLWIDGKKVGAVGLKLREIAASSGTRRLEFKALVGPARVVKQVEVGARQKVTVHAPLGEPARMALPPKAPKKDTTGRSRRWTWITAASAAVAGGVAIGLYVSANSQHDEFRALAAKEAQQRGLDAKDNARINELSDAISGKITGSNISLGLAGALAVTSIVLFFIEGKKSAEASKAAGLRPMIGPVAGASYRIDF